MEIKTTEEIKWMLDSWHKPKDIDLNKLKTMKWVVLNDLFKLKIRLKKEIYKKSDTCTNWIDDVIDRVFDEEVKMKKEICIIHNREGAIFCPKCLNEFKEEIKRECGVAPPEED